MKFPLIGRTNNNPSTSVQNFIEYGASNGRNFINTEAAAKMIVAVGFTMTNFHVNALTAPGVGKNFVYTVRKNGADTALTVTMADTNTTAVDDTHSVTFAAGDFVDIASTPTGTPTASGFLYWRALCDTTGSTTQGQVIIGRTNGENSNTVSNYANLFGGPSALDIVEAVQNTVMPCAGTFSNLQVGTDGSSPSGAASHTFTLRKNGVDQSLSAAMVGASNFTSDTTHSFSVLPGDIVTLKCTPSGTPASTNPCWSVLFTPATPGQCFISWTPVSNPSTSVPNFGIIIGNGFVPSTPETNFFSILGPATINSLFVNANTAPGAGKSYSYTLRKNQTDQLIATMSDTNTTANARGSIPFTNFDYPDIAISPSGTPTVPAGLSISVGVVIPNANFLEFLDGV